MFGDLFLGILGPGHFPGISYHTLGLYATSTGSSLGIRNLLAGGAAVGAASRPIKASDYEKVDCDPAGIGVGGEVLGEC